MKFILTLFLSVLLFSCQQKENKETPQTSVDNAEPVLAPENKNEEETKENKQIEDTIVMSFKNEKGLYAAEGSIDSIHSKVYVKFKNEDLGKLTAKIITTTSKGNIRFNQVIYPDKSSDGPFGMDLKIDLNQKGNHILVIGHSLMADNPYWGKFKVELENK